MSGSSDIKFTADESDLAKAQAKLIKQQEEMIEKYKKVANEAQTAGKAAAKHTADAAKELDRFAKSTKDVNRTPLERYADEMRRLNQSLKTGRIDQETFNRAVAKTKTEFQQAGQAGHQAFGSTAISSIARYAAGMVSVAGSLGIVAKLWTDVNAKAEEYANRQRENFVGVGGLAQTADTVEEMRAAYEASQASYAQGAGGTLGQAANLQFSITSAMFQKYRQDIAELQASGVSGDPITMINAAAAMESSMGTEATGGFRRIVSKAFGAGKIGTTTAEAVTQAAALSGPQAKALGFSVDDLFAGVSTLSKITGNAGEAGTLMESFSKQIEKEGLKNGLKSGRSLMQYVGDIAEMEARGTGIRDILGDRQEAITGYRILRDNRELFQANLANVVDADKTDAFGTKVSLFKAIPEMVGVRALRQAEASEEVARMREGVFSNLAQTVRADIRRGYVERQDEYIWNTPLRPAGMDIAYAAEQYINGPEAFVMRRGELGSPKTQEMIRLAVEALNESAQRQKEAATELRDAAQDNATRRQRAAAAVQPE